MPSCRTPPIVDTAGPKVFERTMVNVRQICAPDVDESWLDFCRQQASLLMELPGCDAACRQLGSPHLSHPTR